MVDWQTLARLTDRELATVPLVALNLACADGLPGCERIDIRHCDHVLQGWAERCRAFTERVMPMFRSGRCDHPDSEPRFRVQAMVTHLQRDIGIRYRFERRSKEAVFTPEDSFLTGILDGKGGTCGSLPVLYADIGRRLGTPIMLADTRCHLYCRWDAHPGGECFNIEASGDGVSFFPDGYFRTGDFEMPAETVEACGYLRSQSPREELAGFLIQRAECRR